jgi:hypothetical protein
MISEHYVWLAWSSAFLLPWLLLFWWFPQHRRAMGWASLFTAPFGLTEPLFVPAYWDPPSLFDLARRTGFDLESFVFCFAIGGIGAVLYNAIIGQLMYPVPQRERQRPLHRYHYLALASPFVVFAVLCFFPWSPIYAGIVAMAVGAVATAFCRPDLKTKSLVGGLLFLGFYAAFLLGLEVKAPGYVSRVWNLKALSGVTIMGMPVEELLFAFGFGMYWFGVYEHFVWMRTGQPNVATGRLHRGRENGPGAVGMSSKRKA